MTPYDMNFPIWQDGLFKGDVASAAFPLASNGGEDAANFLYLPVAFGRSPLGAGGVSLRVSLITLCKPKK